MTQALRLGIDIGGTNTAYGCNESGVIVAQGSISSRGHESPEAFVRGLYQQMKEALPFFLVRKYYFYWCGSPQWQLLYWQY